MAINEKTLKILKDKALSMGAAGASDSRLAVIASELNTARNALEGFADVASSFQGKRAGDRLPHFTRISVAELVGRKAETVAPSWATSKGK